MIDRFPLALAFLVYQCSCSLPPKRPAESPQLPTVTLFAAKALVPAVTPRTNVISLVPWRYPTLTNEYRWSLETTTDFKTWQTVTNYPAGFTNDAVVTNADDSAPHWYRMHGTQP